MNFKNRLLIGSLILAGALIVSIHFTGARSGFFNNDSESREFTIRNGAPFSEIAENLKEEGFIKSKTLFKIYSFITGDINKFKAGRYFLDSELSLSGIARLLAGGPEEISVAVIPGMTLKEIDDKLSENSIIKPGELINFNIGMVKGDYAWLDGMRSLEGFLLPDTYNFTRNSDIKPAVEKFLDNFEKKAIPLFGDNQKNLPDKLIIASILEKEIPDYGEQKIGAGIIEKRMAAGMALQVDASLIYAKCYGRFMSCPQLTALDYKIDSPYNTYFHAGLPPAPISNPGPKTIEAALKAEKSDYWYYLSDPKTKKTIFGKTLDEHNDNRALYLLKR